MMQGFEALFPLNKRIKAEDEVVEDLLYVFSESLNALYIFIYLSASLLKACSQILVCST